MRRIAARCPPAGRGSPTTSRTSNGTPAGTAGVAGNSTPVDRLVRRDVHVGSVARRARRAARRRAGPGRTPRPSPTTRASRSLLLRFLQRLRLPTIRSRRTRPRARVAAEQVHRAPSRTASRPRPGRTRRGASRGSPSSERRFASASSITSSNHGLRCETSSGDAPMPGQRRAGRAARARGRAAGGVAGPAAKLKTRSVMGHPGYRDGPHAKASESMAYKRILFGTDGSASAQAAGAVAAAARAGRRRAADRRRRLRASHRRRTDRRDGGRAGGGGGRAARLGRGAGRACPPTR